MMLPVERLAAPGARIAADFGMSGVGMSTQVRLIEETAPTDTAEVLISAGVQSLVFYIAGVGEECFPACLT